MWVYAFECTVSAWQKRHGSLELEFQEVVRHLVWCWEPDLRFWKNSALNR